ncbi:hypothetical protein [Saccharothrix texasensis]|uniref:Membrane protein YmcC n=1 Tax=Saccharothrix texasensis TaxID=103734 RepID=A0A3N1H0B5_9PSEU|nr:hypothetical protein [Saccharothrix texasensis]ROP35980.1 hypothetical protein EDD40_1239 [Saccharothrix texasensis]
MGFAVQARGASAGEVRAREVLAQAAGQDPVVLYLIVACEIAFWVVLASGLLARYPLRKPRLGGALLLGVPVVDVVLVVACAVDLRTGGTPGMTHSLAAAYLGVSLAFGPHLVRRADAWFAHRFAGGPRPARPPRRGRARQRHEWAMWLRCLAALAVSSALTLVMFLIGGPSTVELWNFEIQLAAVTALWLVGGPLRLTLFPPKTPVGADDHTEEER